MGRRKIEIEKISNKNYLMATFSKRRKGLFHKASEFCRLSGAEIAIVVFSPGDRVYRFGHPSADSIIDRYDDPRTKNNNNKGTREFPYTLDDEGNEAHDDDLAGSKLGKEAADGKDELGKARFWWDNLPIEDMGLKQLEQYKSCLEVIRNELAYELHETKRRESHTKDFLSLIGFSTSTSTSDPVRERNCDIVEEHQAQLSWSSMTSAINPNFTI
ncbi:putative transcription factor MADS-type1 family [Rosa chinensis]|uniref:Putative transcription factor MADS-type1 family n=1 Tax=Rosa chinensis TaxID=74649 RepID=A0A2P6RUH8_ROSCH|nr:agamous-like MADS-box protein AGL62 [Rosa chinensis]PRQ50090.1 putative transcription factor MADS-type1 family [Rosa chinensis]